MENIVINEVHISQIKSGDTILHTDGMRTVSNTNIKRDTFMGTTLFGDSYKLGTVLVKKITFLTLANVDRILT